ncbi:MAG: trypsin-like peptidase domain-containing protein [Ardenticatenaceae bacterium]|nr:trypsin-like peptidase domain-containing protein [Ardenticatenaceae bacterium]
MAKKNVLEQLSEQMADVVASASQSIVRVSGRRRLAATGIVWSADGIIVSANHVVSKKRKSKVTLANGETHEAKVLGRDASTDIAVLKINAEGLQPMAKADGAGLKVGHFVLALGRPGHSTEATLGILSAVGDSWRTGAGGMIDRYLQTDVVMYPGFSGGPLVSAAGELIGLNSSALARGVSVTIPVATLNRVIEFLVSDGHIKRGYLGIKTQGVRLPAGQAEALKQETGLLLVGIEPGSPAEESGLLLGDIIVHFDGQPIRHGDDLISLLGTGIAGQKTPATIIRGGEVSEMSIKVGTK